MGWGELKYKNNAKYGHFNLVSKYRILLNFCLGEGLFIVINIIKEMSYYRMHRI